MKSRVYDRPTAGHARRIIEEGLVHQCTLTLFGRCEVRYAGRASRHLDPGDRLAVLKPDGTLLVHGSGHHHPVAWQPPGCSYDFSVEDGHLRIHAAHVETGDELDLRFDELYLLCSLDVDDRPEPVARGTEADLKRRILAEPTLVEEGFRPFKTERPTPVGAIDIFGRDGEGRAVVVELKPRRVGPPAVSQLKRYVGAVRAELADDTDVRGILIAPSLTDGTASYLAAEGLEFVAVDPVPSDVVP